MLEGHVCDHALSVQIRQQEGQKARTNEGVAVTHHACKDDDVSMETAERIGQAGRRGKPDEPPEVLPLLRRGRGTHTDNQGVK